MVVWQNRLQRIRNPDRSGKEFAGCLHCIRAVRPRTMERNRAASSSRSPEIRINNPKIQPTSRPLPRALQRGTSSQLPGLPPSRFGLLAGLKIETEESRAGRTPIQGKCRQRFNRPIARLAPQPIGRWLVLRASTAPTMSEPVRILRRGVQRAIRTSSRG